MGDANPTEFDFQVTGALNCAPTGISSLNLDVYTANGRGVGGLMDGGCIKLELAPVFLKKIRRASGIFATYQSNGMMLQEKMQLSGRSGSDVKSPSLSVCQSSTLSMCFGGVESGIDERPSLIR